MPLAQFVLYSITDFHAYIDRTRFSRPVRFIQNHHTWRPDYKSFKDRPDHTYWLESMRNAHIKERGWNDIGQNITVFPDGIIALCRPIDVQPAGIFGANRGAICIENLGNFDKGSDPMTQEQKEAIIATNAIFCKKFSLKPQPLQVVYHHWYDTSGNRFPDEEINAGVVAARKAQKSCPGSGFFLDPGDALAGNTLKAAQERFYPLIQQYMSTLPAAPAPQEPSLHTVSANRLNVRSGASAQSPVLRQIGRGLSVKVHERSGDWCRISADSEEWVSAKFLN